jgi:NAD-dependent dihydropyrimidine dehydrogenase PreA subunit
MSTSLKGLSFLGGYANFCGLKLSQKLERKIKLLQFSIKKPKKISYLYKIISNCTIISENSYKEIIQKEFIDRVHKRYSSEYKIMPKGITKDNQDAFNSISGGNGGGSYKMFCTECHFTHKQYKYSFKSTSNAARYIYDDEKCPNCGAKDSQITLRSDVRVPRKKASKKVWKNFYKLFVNSKR